MRVLRVIQTERPKKTQRQIQFVIAKRPKAKRTKYRIVVEEGGAK